MRPAPASAEHEPVAPMTNTNSRKRKSMVPPTSDEYDGDFCLFLGSDGADQGEGHLADT
jgi:hypothetical protein